MDCLASLIGVRGKCGGDDTPDSSFYINDYLTGVSVKNMEAAIDEEATSGFEEIENIITQSGEIVKAYIRQYMRPIYKGGSVIETSNVGKWKKDLETQAAQGLYFVGVQIKSQKFKNLELFLSKLWLHMQTSGLVQVFVFDLTSGTQLDVINLTSVLNVPTGLDIYKKYKTEGQKLNLFIGYDGNEQPYKTNLFTNTNCPSCGSGSEWLNDGQLQFKGAKMLKTAARIDSSIESQTGTSGISFNYALNCTLEPFICSIRDQLAIPIMFKAGSMIMQRMQYSTRLNSIISTRGEDWAALKEFYEGEFVKLMEDVVKNAYVNDPVCFECNHRVKTVVNVG